MRLSMCSVCQFFYDVWNCHRIAMDFSGKSTSNRKSRSEIKSSTLEKKLIRQARLNKKSLLQSYIHIKNELFKKLFI